MNLSKQVPQETIPVYERIYQIETDLITPNRAQPRSDFDSNAIIRLADSIRRYGIVQPLTVRSPQPGNPNYELVAGERRYRAARMLGYKTVPCIIMSVGDKESAELSIIENLLREDLNMFEQANAFRRLIDEHSMTQHEVARRLSMSQSAVANKMRLLKLTDEEREIILDNHLTERHGRAILKITDSEKRLSILKHIASSCLNVSSAETYIDNILESASQSDTSVDENSIRSEADSRSENSVSGFVKSIDRAISMLRTDGADVDMIRTETDTEILLSISVSKKPAAAS